jgi:outer membrane immunogenic protein
MKKLLLSVLGVVTLGLALPAAAADLPARPYTKAPAIVPVAIYDWSGFYIGANGGWGSSRKCWDDIGAFTAGSDGCHDATGGVAGGQIGYRWQASSWVFGLEGQGNWADLKGSNTTPLLRGAFTDQSRIKAFGLFTGQIGYAVNNVLFYVKGGGAVTSDRFEIFSGPLRGDTLVANTGDQTRWGGTAGAGIEFGFAPNWSAAFEYNHLFMGSKDTTFLSTGPFLPGSLFSTERIKQDVDIATVRVNYRFGWGGPVVAKY